MPSIYLALPKPKSNQVNYLNYDFINYLINTFRQISFLHKKRVFIVSSIILIFSFYGLSKIKSVSFLVDDVPAESSLMKDLKFFESNFSGVMPLEIVVDTKSYLYLIGTTLDYSGGLNGNGFVFNNPNATRTCGCGESFSL